MTKRGSSWVLGSRSRDQATARWMTNPPAQTNRRQASPGLVVVARITKRPTPSRQALVAGQRRPSLLCGVVRREWRKNTRPHQRRPSPARLLRAGRTSVPYHRVPCLLRMSGRSRRLRSSRMRPSSSTFRTSGNRHRLGTSTTAKRTDLSSSRRRNGLIWVESVGPASLIHHPRIYPRPHLHRTLSLDAHSWLYARQGPGCPHSLLAEAEFLVRTLRDDRLVYYEGTTRAHRSIHCVVTSLSFSGSLLLARLI